MVHAGHRAADTSNIHVVGGGTGKGAAFANGGANPHTGQQPEKTTVPIKVGVSLLARVPLIMVRPPPPSLPGSSPLLVSVVGLVKGYPVFFFHPSCPRAFQGDLGVCTGPADKRPSSDDQLTLGVSVVRGAVIYESPVTLGAPNRDAERKA